LLVIPRPIGRELQDYRSYFANFFCILTSVYEQRVALTTGATTSSSSIASTNISATVAHAGDQALRLQLKLYQSWETIMHDYATVFGNASSTTMTATGSPYTAHYRINSQTRKEVSDIVVTALEKLGDWDEHPSGLGLKTTWNLLWTWSKPNVERKTLLAWQKVNHFQHAKAITRKDCLKKSIAKYHAMSGRLKQAYDIVPASFLLPQEYVAFVQAFQARARLVPTGKNIWIMKPVALSRGRGISLVNDLSDVVYGEQVVIQEYIANPLLLDGFKFDLRLYVLVTSFNPLEAFFYEEGFVRMCTRAYEDGDLSNLFIHLTNSSIQKENQDAFAGNPENPINAAQTGTEAGGTKMTLAYLWKRLETMGADVATVKNDILSVILKALLCGEDQIPFQVNSFDLYGYDILLDTNFRPWLIEVNSSPSMARENELDYQVKDALIYDTLRLVKPLHFDRCKLSEVLARRFHDAEMDKKRSHANTRHPKEAEAIATRQLNEDLTEILRGQVPRAFGELPEHMGSYTRIAPYTTIHNQVRRLLGRARSLALERSS
jgi:tubulin polyglutamylase TTLL5